MELCFVMRELQAILLFESFETFITALLAFVILNNFTWLDVKMNRIAVSVEIRSCHENPRALGQVKTAL